MNNDQIPYFEKLKDPRWQKRRTEVLQAANFTCEDCGAKDIELHVHHCIYEKGREPWEYANTLICVCKNCHKTRQEHESKAHMALAILMRHSKIMDIAGLYNFLYGLAIQHPKFLPIDLRFQNESQEKEVSNES
jgi:hypothetical protein